MYVTSENRYCNNNSSSNIMFKINPLFSNTISISLNKYVVIVSCLITTMKKTNLQTYFQKSINGLFNNGSPCI